MLHIQPDEGVSLRFEAKVPGPAVRLSGVDMDFRYADYFNASPSTGYETLLYDCLIGDPTLFQRADNIEAGWRAVQPFLDAWREVPDDLHGYAAGSWGPRQADRIAGAAGCPLAERAVTASERFLSRSTAAEAAPLRRRRHAGHRRQGPHPGDAAGSGTAPRGGHPLRHHQQPPTRRTAGRG